MTTTEYDAPTDHYDNGNGTTDQPRRRAARRDIRMAKDENVGPTLANELREHAEALLAQANEGGLSAGQRRILSGRASLVEKFAQEIEDFHGGGE